MADNFNPEIAKSILHGDGRDNINPTHYKHDGIETIDVISAWTKGLEGIQATDTGNIIKYISRWKQKNGIEDLKKAQWYLNHLIKEVESSEPKEIRESIDDKPLILKAVRKFEDLRHNPSNTVIMGLFKDTVNHCEETYEIGAELDEYECYNSFWAMVPYKDLYERRRFIFNDSNVEDELYDLLNNFGGNDND